MEWIRKLYFIVQQTKEKSSLAGEELKSYGMDKETNSIVP